MQARSALVASGLILLAWPTTASAGAYLRVVSWNLRHEGWSGDRDYLGAAEQIWYEFGATSSANAGADVAFLQEVMYPEAATQIALELSLMSGKPWSALVTAPIGRTSYKECYAVVWRTDRASIVSHEVWNDVGDRFEREPHVVKVRDVATRADFTFINWHAVFGTTTQRQAEVRQIATVFSAVQAADRTDQDVILLGDHNAPATSAWWTDLTSILPPVTYRVNDLTTLNASGAYASAYDHFWLQPKYVTEVSSAGRDYVQDTISFRDQLSDHAPIWLKLYSSYDSD